MKNKRLPRFPKTLLTKVNQNFMKRIFLLVFYFLLCGLSNFVDAQVIQWSKSIGAPTNDVSSSIATDAFGNVYTTGEFLNVADFDPGAGTYTIASAGGNDVFISKLDPLGNFVWAKSMGGTQGEKGNYISLDALGNIYTTGYFYGTEDFDPGPGVFNLVSTQLAAFISKLDASGNFIWAKAISGPQAVWPSCIKIDASGNVYTVGYFGGTPDFDPGAGTFTLTSVGGSNDIFISKLDPSGNFVWAKSMGGSSSDIGNSLALDALGNVYTSGSFSGIADLDPGAGTFSLTSLGGSDVFVSKLDPSGSFVWGKAMGGVSTDEAFAITIDPSGSGSVYTSGRFGGTSDFDPGSGTFNLNSAGSFDAFISKLDLAGNFIWAKAMGGVNSDGVYSIAVDGVGNIYSTGVFSGVADFDPGIGTFNLTIGANFISKLDGSGNFLWAGGINNTGVSPSITVDAASNFYYAGCFNLTSDFNPGSGTYTITSSGGTDVCVAKYTPCTLSAIINATNVTCFGSNNGTASVTPTGSSPYSYSWSNTSTLSSITGLIAGNYSVTIIDANSCINSQTTTITQPPALSLSISSLSITCFGGSNGTASVVASGFSPFTYLWSNTSTSSSIVGLNSGNYSVTVTDGNGCSKSQVIYIPEPPPMTLSFNNTITSCQGSNDGASSVSVIANGTPPYTYSWSTGSTISTISGLAAGNYNVIVTDANSCSWSQNTVITQPTNISASFSTIPSSKCSGSCNGSAVLSTNGGTSPYSYLWDATAGNQTTANPVGLCSGTYSVTITDSKGCTLVKQVTLTQTAPSTFDSQVYLTNIAAVDLVNVSPSFATYYVYDLPSTINPNASNPRNFVDPGRYARFKVQTENKKSNGQSIVSGSCKVRTNSTYVTLTDSASALNNVGWNTKAWSVDEFEVYIKPNTPPGSNIYLDFVVQENTNNYVTTCIAIPVTPLVYSPTTNVTIDDDSNPDSQGNNNDVCEPTEIIEYYPWMNNISTFSAEYVRGSFENLDNLSYINIWDNVMGASGTVYKSSWWNYSFSVPNTISVGQNNMTPQFDFVFNYNNTLVVNNFKLYMVMAGGFKLFGGSALTLVQWTLPYTFNNTSIGIDENKIENGLKIYPNPFNENATIEIKNESALSDNTFIIIYDITGRELRKTEISNFESKIQRGDLSNGIYIYRIESKNRIIANGKLVIE